MEVIIQSQAKKWLGPDLNIQLASVKIQNKLPTISNKFRPFINTLLGHFILYYATLADTHLEASRTLEGMEGGGS